MSLTVPQLDTWTAGENPTAAKMTNNVKTHGDFLRRDRPVYIATTSATLGVLTATATDVNAKSIVYDNAAGNSGGANNFYTFPCAGIYRLTGYVLWPSGSTGVRQAQFSVTDGGTVVYVPDFAYPAAAVVSNDIEVMLKVSAAGATAKLQVSQTSGSTVTLAVGACRFEIEWVAEGS